MLELGSGTGLVGLVAGMLGANVWITDQAYVSVLVPCRSDIDGHTSGRCFKAWKETSH